MTSLQVVKAALVKSSSSSSHSCNRSRLIVYNVHDDLVAIYKNGYIFWCFFEINCNNVQAFDIAEKELGITSIMSGYEMISREIVDKTTMVSYLSQFYELFRKQSVERDAGKIHCHDCY